MNMNRAAKILNLSRDQRPKNSTATIVSTVEREKDNKHKQYRKVKRWLDFDYEPPPKLKNKGQILNSTMSASHTFEKQW